MIITLLVVKFLITAGLGALAVLFFNHPFDAILKRIVPPEITFAWVKYLRYAIVITGIASGVNVYEFEKYLAPQGPGTSIQQLTPERWVLEIYQAVIGALQGIAMVLLVFFVFALIAVVIVRLIEARKPTQPPAGG